MYDFLLLQTIHLTKQDNEDNLQIVMVMWNSNYIKV